MRPASIAVAIAAAMVIGLVLGAVVYPRLAGTGASPQPPSEARENDGHNEAEGTPDTVEIDVEAQKEVGITVEAAELRDIGGVLYSTGMVGEDPGKVTHLRPLARGLVEKSYVRLGARVAKGDPLVEYDNIELGDAIGEYLGAQAELRRGLTDLEVKKTLLDRGAEMLKAGALAQNAYDTRQAEYRDAEARADGARAAVARIAAQMRRFGLSDTDLASLSKNRDAVSGGTAHGGSSAIWHSVLKAPASGVVTELHAAPGEVVESSTELLSITDMSSLWVLADVFEKDLSHVRRGKDVKVRVAAYPEKVFQGKITYVADAIDPETRAAKVRCVVVNNEGLLKLGMFATIEIPTEQIRQVAAVPIAAIQRIDDRPFVFVQTTATEFQRREVRAGTSGGGYVEILSGVKAGESVAVKGSFVVKSAFLRDSLAEDEHGHGE